MAYKNKPGHDATGRLMPYYSRADGKTTVLQKLGGISTGGQKVESGEPDRYEPAKKAAEAVVINPFEVNIGGNKATVISLVVPICDRSVKPAKVLGAIGVDYNLANLREAIKKITPYPESEKAPGYATLLSNNGAFVAHPDPARWGKDLGDTDARKKAKEQIAKGEEVKFEDITTNATVGSTVTYKAGAPVFIGDIKTTLVSAH